PLAKGDALLDGGRHGAGQLGGVIAQRIIACRHCGIDARFQVSQVAQFTDDAPTDVLDHGGDVRVGWGLALHKTWLEILVTAIQIDSFKEDAMEMEGEIDGTPETLDKRHRSRLNIGSLKASSDCLVHIILPNRGANDCMDHGGEVL